MLQTLEVTSALDLSARLCCVGILLQSLEVLTVWPELRDKHLLGWQQSGRTATFVQRAWSRAQRFPINLAVIGWRTGAAAACLVLPPNESPFAWFLLCTLLLAQLYMNRCVSTFFANFDHLTLVCLAGIVIGSLPGGSESLRLVGAGFIAFQSCLAYFASGVDKISKPHWRDGSWLTKVFCDSSHRFMPLGLWLRRNRWGAVSMSWGVTLLELFFPLCLVLPPAGFWCLIAGALAFHVMVAVIMALPGFFWAFSATYPALFVMHGWLALHLRS